MQCPKCGTENRVGVKFCKKCGSNMIGLINDTQELSGALPINKKKSKKWLLFIFVILIVIVILASVIYFAVLEESTGNTVALRTK